jgi:hypothetical protein
VRSEIVAIGSAGDMWHVHLKYSIRQISYNREIKWSNQRCDEAKNLALKMRFTFLRMATLCRDKYERKLQEDENRI